MFIFYLKVLYKIISPRSHRKYTIVLAQIWQLIFSKSMGNSSKQVSQNLPVDNIHEFETILCHVKWGLWKVVKNNQNGKMIGFTDFTYLVTTIFKGFTFMPCPFTGPKMFWAGPNFLCQTKNLFTYCGSHKLFVPDKKMICIQ